ncbi:MAG TPA: hypothetical protein VHB73_00800, partial [Alphaproteobacteria bacterium]|nr:hypothetical protein [Alphaproteobacteria bacterium]
LPLGATYHWLLRHAERESLKINPELPPLAPGASDTGLVVLVNLYLGTTAITLAGPKPEIETLAEGLRGFYRPVRPDGSESAAGSLAAEVTALLQALRPIPGRGPRVSLQNLEALAGVEKLVPARPGPGQRRRPGPTPPSRM